MLSLLLAVDATIVSESSSIDLIGSVGLAFEGALIGNYDEEANPQGTLTRPGLFGGSGNQPISTSLSFAVGFDDQSLPEGQVVFALEGETLVLSSIEAALPNASVNLGLELLFETFRSIAPDSLFFGGIPLPLEIGAVDLTSRAVRMANPVSFILLPAPGGEVFAFSGPLPLLYEGVIDLQGTPTPISFPFTLEVDGQISSDGAELSMSASTSVNESFPPETPVGFADIPLPLPTILPPGETANCLLSQDLMQIDSTLDVGFVLVASAPSGPEGDADGDGDVDFEDLVRVLAEWGECLAPGACSADFNADGEVGFEDLLVVLTGWQ